MDVTAEQRSFSFYGALLLLLSLLNGGLVAGAMSGKLPMDARILLSAHVTGLIGSVFIFAAAFTLPLLSFGPVGRKRLMWTLVVANYANLIIGTAKSIPAVHGVDLNDNAANNVVFGLLNVFVVVPLLGAAIAWCLGLRRRPA